MDGGYNVFMERLQSDFAASNVAKEQSSNKAPNTAFMYPTAYSVHPSFSNAVSVKREPSSSPMEPSLTRNSSTPLDVHMQESSADSHNFSSDVNQMPDVPLRHRGHRRAHSEIPFRLPDDITFDQDRSLLETPTVSDEANDDFFSMYIDMDKINTHSMTPTAHSLKPPPVAQPSQPDRVRSVSVDDMFGYEGMPSRARHQHSNSMDGSSTLMKQDQLVSESYEIKKAITAEKLAELALLDPKRAKRILANRQSAARSKERKMRHISELECKMQTLQMEATTLSAQLTMLQRDTAGLTSENNKLKLRLQSMEQQAQLRDALNDTLREEVQGLKLVTGQFMPSSKDMTFFQCMQPAASEGGLGHEGEHPKEFVSVQQGQQHVGSVCNKSTISQEGLQGRSPL